MLLVLVIVMCCVLLFSATFLVGVVGVALNVGNVALSLQLETSLQSSTHEMKNRSTAVVGVGIGEWGEKRIYTAVVGVECSVLGVWFWVCTTVLW